MLVKNGSLKTAYKFFSMLTILVAIQVMLKLSTFLTVEKLRYVQAVKTLLVTVRHITTFTLWPIQPMTKTSATKNYAAIEKP